MKIMEIPEVNIDLEHVLAQGFQEIILFSLNQGTVRGVFDPVNKLTQYKLITNEIHAQEVLTQRGKDFIRLSYQKKPILQAQTGGLLHNLGYSEDLFDEYQDMKKPKKKRNPADVFGKSYIFNNHSLACDKFEALKKLERLSDELYAVAYHRRFIVKKNSFFNSF